MTADPFAEAEAEAVAETTEHPEQSAPTAPALAKDDPDANKVRVTFKGGTGYDAPWITVDGTNIQDTREQLSDLEGLKALMDDVARFGRYFSGTGAKGSQNGSQGQQGAPVHQQPPPGVTVPDCAHGPMVFRSGFSKKTEKPYKGFFCSQNSSGCKPQFLPAG